MPTQRPDAARPNLRMAEDSIGQFQRRVQYTKLQDRLEVQRVETHQKFIICDDKFCEVVSFNWLSYRGEEPHQESSHYSERVETSLSGKGSRNRFSEAIIEDCCNQRDGVFLASRPVSVERTTALGNNCAKSPT